MELSIFAYFIILEDNLAMGLVERCFDLSKEFFGYRCKGWEFVPDQV